MTVAAFLRAAVARPVAAAGAEPYLLMIGYLLSLAFLVGFGIWGFRIGSGGFDGSNGGGSKLPDAGPWAPPSGGRKLTDDFATEWADGSRAPRDEPAGVGRG